MAKFCGKCGTQLENNAPFCPNCGNAIAKASAESNSVSKDNESPKKSKSKLRIIIACTLAIVILVVGTIGGLKLFGNKNVDITNDVNYTAFNECFTDVLITDEESAIEAISSISNLLGIKDVSNELKSKTVNQIGEDKFYRLQQYYNDIPVYGKTIVVSSDKDNRASALTSNFTPIKEDVELTPTITLKELQKSLQEYFDVDEINCSVNDKNLVIYQEENNKFILAYEIEVFGQRVLIDAHTANILEVTSLYLQEMVECNYKDGSFQGIKVSENEYQIGNDDKGIFVFNANYKDVIKQVVDNGNISYVSVPENSLPMTSTDNFFGNNDTFEADEYAKAVYMLRSLETISNYYHTLNSNQNTSVITTINDSYDPGNAFGGYVDISEVTTAKIPYNKDRIISIFFGEELSKDIYGHLDTLGHEYTHGINHYFFKSDKDEASAMDEGYADIFGELLEARIKNQNPNWIHGERNIINPHEYENAKYPYPASMNDLENAETFTSDGCLWYRTTENSGTDFSHFASTVISHCAYLMWNGIDGNGERKINPSELGELWYGSLMFLQDNADFEQCRNAVELSARNMLKTKKLTEEQYKTVLTAFETVGIKNAPFTYTETVKNKFDLSVLSAEDTENVTFKLEVIKMPTIKAGPNILNDEIPKLVLEKNAIKGSQKLDLKDGTYVIRITDLDEKNIYSKTITTKIVVDGNNKNATDEIVIHTDFTDIITVVLNDSSQENLYDDVIKQYREAIKNNFYADVDYDMDVAGEYINQELLFASQYTQKFKVFYALTDLNKDGISEMIIGAGENANSVGKYDIFTLSGNDAVRLFDNESFGYRTNFTLYDTGIIYIIGSGGAEYHSYEYYELPANSTKEKYLEGYSVEFDVYTQVDSDFKTIKTISESEFNAVSSKYKSAEVVLNWVEITADDKKPSPQNTAVDKLFNSKISDLSSKYGTVGNKNLSKTVAGNTDPRVNVAWANINGVIGEAIFDFDNDRQNELLIVRMSNDSENRTTEILEIYEANNGSVTLTDSRELTFGAFGNLESMNLGTYIAETNNKKYICVESLTCGSFVDYHSPLYYVFEVSNGKIKDVMMIENTYGGTDGYEYTMHTWDKSGKKSSVVIDTYQYDEIKQQGARSGKYSNDESPILSAFKSLGFPNTKRVLTDYSLYVNGGTAPCFLEQKGFTAVSLYKANCKYESNNVKIEISTKNYD